jgi:hypothetical protein
MLQFIFPGILICIFALLVYKAFRPAIAKAEILDAKADLQNEIDASDSVPTKGINKEEMKNARKKLKDFDNLKNK